LWLLYHLYLPFRPGGAILQPESLTKSNDNSTPISQSRPRYKDRVGLSLYAGISCSYLAPVLFVNHDRLVATNASAFSNLLVIAFTRRHVPTNKQPTTKTHKSNLFCTMRTFGLAAHIRLPLLGFLKPIICIIRNISGLRKAQIKINLLDYRIFMGV
jgi:hypothetical protein